jgi:2-keto-4-pentenoate hydratase
VTAADDPRVARGMAVQLEGWRALVAAGHPRVGWKIGFNVGTVQRALGLPGPVIGHLTLATAVVPGEVHSLAGAARVVVEPEIAVHLGVDVPPGADAATARAAITGLGAALEVVDYREPVADLERVVAGNVFHRAFAVGPTHPGRAGGALDGIVARLLRNDEAVATADAAEVAGDLEIVVRFVADFLARFGEGLRAGDRIIAGTLTPPVPAGPGDVIAVELGPLGSVRIAFAGG